MTDEHEQLKPVGDSIEEASALIFRSSLASARELVASLETASKSRTTRDLARSLREGRKVWNKLRYECDIHFADEEE